MRHVPVPPPRSPLTETADGVELVVPKRRFGTRKLLSTSVGLVAPPFTVRGAVKFDHGRRVVTLAEGLDEPEARSIVRLLGERDLAHVEPT